METKFIFFFEGLTTKEKRDMEISGTDYWRQREGGGEREREFEVVSE